MPASPDRYSVCERRPFITDCHRWTVCSSFTEQPARRHQLRFRARSHGKDDHVAGASQNASLDVHEGCLESTEPSAGSVGASAARRPPSASPSPPRGCPARTHARTHAWLPRPPLLLQLLRLSPTRPRHDLVSTSPRATGLAAAHALTLGRCMQEPPRHFNTQGSKAVAVTVPTHTHIEAHTHRSGSKEEPVSTS